MKLNRLLILPLVSFSLMGCDLFEKKGDINDYVGEYILYTANERTYHIYWSQKTLTNEKELDIKVKSLTINEDKTVNYVTKDGESGKGKIKCLEKYCRFYNIPSINSNHKFNLRYDHTLYYSHESSHMGVEYDVTYVNIEFKKVSKL